MSIGVLKASRELSTRENYYVSDFSPYVIEDLGDGSLSVTNIATPRTSLAKNIQLSTKKSMSECKGFCVYDPWLNGSIEQSLSSVFLDVYRLGCLFCENNREYTQNGSVILVLWFEGGTVDVLDIGGDQPMLDVDIQELSTAIEKFDMALDEATYEQNIALDVPSRYKSAERDQWNDEIEWLRDFQPATTQPIKEATSIVIPRCCKDSNAHTVVTYAVVRDENHQEKTSLVTKDAIELFESIRGGEPKGSLTSNVDLSDLYKELREEIDSLLSLGSEKGNVWSPFIEYEEDLQLDLLFLSTDVIGGGGSLDVSSIVEVVSVKSISAFVLVDMQGNVYFQRFLSPVAQQPNIAKEFGTSIKDEFFVVWPLPKRRNKPKKRPFVIDLTFDSDSDSDTDDDETPATKRRKKENQAMFKANALTNELYCWTFLQEKLHLLPRYTTYHDKYMKVINKTIWQSVKSLSPCQRSTKILCSLRKNPPIINNKKTLIRWFYEFARSVDVEFQ